MKKTLSVLALALLTAGGTSLRAQDIHFSQFYENAALRNPALVGIFTGDYRAGVNYRNQWSNLATPFQTTMFTSEYAFKPSKESRNFFAVGLTATYDKAGEIAFNSLQLLPSVNFIKAIDDGHNSFISAGFGVGYIQRSFDPSKMTFNSQYGTGGYDPAAATGESFPVNKIQQLDFSAGVSFNSSLGERRVVNYYVGAAAYHLTRPEESFMSENRLINLPSRFTGQMGVDFRIADQLSITAHLNYTNQHPYQEWIGGGLLRWSHRNGLDKNRNFAVSAGSFYRLGDAIIPTFKFEHRNYYVVVSYDVTSSALGQINSHSGGFELSLFTRGFMKREIDKTQCPRFELLMDENGHY